MDHSYFYDFDEWDFGPDSYITVADDDHSIVYEYFVNSDTDSADEGRDNASFRATSRPFISLFSLL